MSFFSPFPVQMMIKTQRWWDDMIKLAEGQIRPCPAIGECYKVQEQQIIGSPNLINHIARGVTSQWAAQKLKQATPELLSVLNDEYRKMKASAQDDIGRNIELAQHMKSTGNAEFQQNRYPQADSAYEAASCVLTALLSLNLAHKQKAMVTDILSKVYFNRACCAMKRQDLFHVVYYCTAALEHDKDYAKADRLRQHVFDQWKAGKNDPEK